MFRLTLIIAIRTSDFTDYRRRIQLRDSLDLQGIATIIVDDGCPLSVSREIREFCEARSYEYIRLDSSFEPFSASRARNAGTIAAKTEWICYEDADLVYPTDHYQKILLELDRLDDTPFNFLTIPIAYIHEAPSLRIFEAGSVDPFYQELISAILLEDPTPNPRNKIIQSYAPATSAIAVRRSLALLVGGWDETFVGWGGEDRDFAFRLVHANNKITRPAAFSATKGWNLNDTVVYEGWRSLYRMYGDYLAMKGIYGFHLYHEPNTWKSGSKSNIEYAREKAKTLSTKPAFLPMHDPASPSDVLIGNNPHVANEQVLGMLVNPRIVLEQVNKDPQAFVEDLVSSNIRNVVFWNPYGSPWRRQVYDLIRSRGVTTIVGERGALPRTLYFDKGGLSVESETYAEKNWKADLTEEETIEVRSYLENLRHGSVSLEKQADRMGLGLLRMRLGIPTDRKILFVPFQLSDDTVTTYFSEPDRSYAVYVDEVRRLSLLLPPEWVLVYKNHPLAIEQIDMPSAIRADNYHIHDLIEASQAVCVFNSGVGLESLAFYKPVFCYGRSFYRIDGINERFESALAMRDRLQDIPAVDPIKVDRFFHHLLNNVYSFADWTGRLEKKNATSKVFKLESLFYTTLRIDGYGRRDFTKAETRIERTVLFDRFRHHTVSSSKPKTVISAPAATKNASQPVTDMKAIHTVPAPASIAIVDPDLAFEEGAAKYHAGQLMEAAQIFEAVGEMKPDRHEPYRCAAEAFFKLGKTDKAREMLARAKTLAPGNRNLAARIEQMSASGWKKFTVKHTPFEVPASLKKKKSAKS